MCRLWCSPLSCHLCSEIGPALQEEQPTLSSWQSFTYCNYDKIKLPSSMDLHSYNPWKFRYTSLEQLTITPTLILTFKKVLAIIANFSENSTPLVSYSTEQECTHKSCTQRTLRISFRTYGLVCHWVVRHTFAPLLSYSLACFTARVWLARLLLSATAHEWRNFYLVLITKSQKG